jgi:hypothetical protein
MPLGVVRKETTGKARLGVQWICIGATRGVTRGSGSMKDHWMGGGLFGALLGSSLGACFGGLFAATSESGHGTFEMPIVALMCLGIAGMVTAIFLSQRNQWDSVVRHRWARLYLAIVFPGVWATQCLIVWQLSLRDAMRQSLTTDVTVVMYAVTAGAAILIVPFVISAIRVAHRL